jgi:demethoxyubiquinone hydroxylase (CLK1/Coq7/Cat5 family)
MDEQYHREQLIAILQQAYSGEMAAAYAYRGHWRSLTDTEQRTRIRQIESEEWLHRKKVADMLIALEAQPSRYRETRSWLIGRTLGWCCHVAGWFLPMYFAGKLETQNVDEYTKAALHASALGCADFVQALQTMAVVEKEHEEFFMNIIAKHRLSGLMRKFFN